MVAVLALLLAPLSERTEVTATAAAVARGIPLCYFCDEQSGMSTPPGETVPVLVTWWECAEEWGTGYSNCSAEAAWVLRNGDWAWEADCEEQSPTESCLPLDQLASSNLTAAGRVALLPAEDAVMDPEERGCGNTLLSRRYDSDRRERLMSISSALTF